MLFLSSQDENQDRLDALSQRLTTHQAAEGYLNLYKKTDES